MPALFCTDPPLPEVENAGSAALCVASASTASSQATAPASSGDLVRASQAARARRPVAGASAPPSLARANPSGKRHAELNR